MNLITDNIKTGTVGEILVQLRLLEHGVQAAPPIKDSGNDLIAIRGAVFRAIQVKTTTINRFNKNNLPNFYHILAVVQLFENESQLMFDNSKIFLVPFDEVNNVGTQIDSLTEFTMTSKLINRLFREE